MESRHPEKRPFSGFETEAIYFEERAILEFTENIVQAMQQQGLKRSELAKRLGNSKPYITEILQGSTNFSFRTAVRLALAVGKRFSSMLEDHNELQFYIAPSHHPSTKAAEGEAAVSRTHSRWIFERAASLSVEAGEWCS